MHAEQRGSMGQAVAVTDDAPTSNSSDAVLISTDSKESGLWLWQGDAPSPPSFPRPKSRDRHILRRIMPAAGWAGWIALPTGLALTLIAILMIPHPDRPVSADRPAVAPSSATSPTIPPSSAPSPTIPPSSAPSPAVTPSSATSPPPLGAPVVAAPPPEPATARLDQEKVPSAPAAQIMTRTPEPRMAKSRAQHKSSRVVRKTHLSHVRRGPLFPIPGVLTPPPMTWHGDGY
jgi:hypothetical protein